MAAQGAFYMHEYKELQQFETVAEKNEHVKQVRYYFAEELNNTQLEVLDFISQHACTVIGVAKLKVETIAEAIGKSVRTVNYATKRLHDLSIVSKVETTRKVRGGDGANVYVINENSIDCKATCSGNCSGGIAERPVSETPTESKGEEAKTENENLYSFKNLSKNPYKSLKDFEKNNNTNLVKDIELEDEPLFADTNKFLRLAYAGLTSVEGNDITKRLVLAYKKSGMSLNTAWTLQEYCELHTDFAKELAERVRNCVTKHRNGHINDSLNGYIYSTAKKFFENHIAVVDGTIAASKDFVDFTDSPVFERILNAKIERPVAYKAPVVHNHIEFDNEGLPW